MDFDSRLNQIEDEICHSVSDSMLQTKWPPVELSKRITKASLDVTEKVKLLQHMVTVPENLSKF